MPPPGFKKFVLSKMPGTPKQLREATGLPTRTVTGILTKAMAAGDCHITKWSRALGTSGAFQPTYTAGPGVNKVCRLKPLTDKQVGQRYWASIKDDERGDRRRARDQALYFERKARARGDATNNALFGRSP